MPAYLVEHRDRAVGKDELVASIWERVDVSDTQLSQTVLRARRAVDDDGQTQNVIRTVSRFGYRWVADVVEAEGQRPAPAPKTKADTAPGGRASLFARPVGRGSRSESGFSVAIRRYRMNRLLAALLLTLPATAVHATQVIDDFESGTNPNEWGWTNGGGAFTIEPDGGNPGAWLDSDVPYFSDHPNLTSIPPEGSALREALASGTLASARIDLEELDTSTVENCHPTSTLPSALTLEFINMHSDPGGAVIEAHNDDGPESPGGPFPWLTATFPIASDATDVPPGWVLNAPPELNYTWQDLMHNIDGIRFFVVNPEDITFDSCWHLGADNVVITYGDTDTIFTDGFDVISKR